MTAWGTFLQLSLFMLATTFLCGVNFLSYVPWVYWITR